ncbi:MAG: hypothetical protein ABI120_20020, partial [Gemmatimonadaceae bacterium]
MAVCSVALCAPDRRIRESTHRTDGSVSRIDPRTNVEVARIQARAPTAAGDISAGGGTVGLSVDGKPATGIDARTNTVTHQDVGGAGADGLRYGVGAGVG